MSCTYSKISFIDTKLSCVLIKDLFIAPEVDGQLGVVAYVDVRVVLLLSDHTRLIKAVSHLCPTLGLFPHVTQILLHFPLALEHN